MKVLYITGMDSTKYGGLEKYNIALAKNGINLSLVYNSIPKSEEYLNDIENSKIQLYNVEGGYISRMIQILKIIVKEKPSIIHYHFGKSIYVLVPLCFVLFPRLTQIYTIHCEFPKLSKIETFLMNISFRCLDLIVCVSEGVKSGIPQRYRDSKKCVVSYLGVKKRPLKEQDLKKKLNIAENTVILTSIGFDIDVKGYDILAESVSRLNLMKNVPPYKILIIGLSQPEEESLKGILKRLKVEEYFIFVGIVDNIDDFLNISDIYLQPSRSEAISLSIMEAMQYALPIIGTNTGGIPEVCIDSINGFLFPKEDVTTFTQLMYNLICDYNLRASLGRKSIELSYQFSLDASVSKLISMYHTFPK